MRFKRVILRLWLWFALLYCWFCQVYLRSREPDFYSQQLILSIVHSSSMLQNTLSIGDNPYLVECFNWINSNTAEDSALATHPAFYDLARIYVNGRPILYVPQNPSMIEHLRNETSLVDGIVDASRKALDAGNSSVYTVWWNGDGWYKIPLLPSDFKEVYQSGRMSVYSYAPAA